MRNKKGFTLIELLVVIAIIAMLLAILLPSLNTAKEMAAGIVCMAHLRGLSMAFYLYAEDNDSKVARSNQGSDRWVDRPQDNNGNDTNHNSTVPEKENGIMKGTLWPYVEAVKAYHCAGDKRYRVNVRTRGKGPYRSFAMPETIGDIDSNGDATSFTVTSDLTGKQYNIKSLVRYSDFKTPGSSYIFVEENYTHGSGTPGTDDPDMGFNTGVWSFWHGDTYEAWWDPLAPWHNDKTNLGYADGHGEKLVWKDKRTIIFSKDRFDPRLGTDKHSCATQLNNVDQEYMSRAFPRAKN